MRYADGRAVTANEIHIPVDTRVNVVATTADVIHSFWVPALNRKIDMIPGRATASLLYADQAGRLPRAVRAVLRRAARQHGAEGVRRAARGVPGWLAAQAAPGGRAVDRAGRGRPAACS